jgi:hypothetical protein
MLAFTPSPPTPASGPDQAYYFYDTDNDAINWWDGANWQASGGTGTVTNTGTLTDHALIVGNGGVDVSAVGSLGTTTKVLHGAAAGDPTWSAVVEADITLADNTTNNVTSTAHGFAPKSPGSATQFLNGSATAAWSTPDQGSIPLTSQTMNSFIVEIINTAGTLQARLMGDAVSGGAAGYASKIVNQNNSLVNVPTVAVGQDFSSNGLGITGNTIVFNTAAQTIANYFGQCIVEYYDGNVSPGPRAYGGFVSRNVNGNTVIRLEIYLVTILTAGAFTINTTNLPSGKLILVRWTGFLA